jgi:uncharacterized protein YodC (DUF2158 family)
MKLKLKNMNVFKFKHGDLVKLKDGGPVMMVTGKKFFTRKITCVWLDDLHRRHSSAFPPDELMKA